MEDSLTRRAILVGHLELTVPAIAGILLVPFFGLRMFGPSLFLYYLLAGIALAWQWYSVAEPSWKQWLVGKGVPQEEADNLAHRAGLAWPAGIAGIGFFALHTTAAAICGIHLGPWLLSRWHAWILPLLGMSSHTPTGTLCTPVWWGRYGEGCWTRTLQVVRHTLVGDLRLGSAHSHSCL